MITDNNYAEAVISMRKRTTRLEREGDYWTQEEKEQLISKFESGMGITEIAISLQRTEPAIIQQIEKLDLYRRKEAPSRRKLPRKHCVCLCDTCQAERASCPRCGARSTAAEDSLC